MAAVSLQSRSSEVLPSYAQAREDTPPSIGPSGTGRIEQTHVQHLVKNGREWLTLSLISQTQSTHDLPRFGQGNPLSGSVKLSLTHDTVIRSVSVSVIGELTSAAYYSRFLTITRQLFVSDANDLISSLPDSPSIHAGKLNGEHSWPFLIRLPKGVSIVLSDDAKHNFRLPPTLSSQATESKTQIRYRVVARVKKGLLGSIKRLAADFVYAPQFRPSQPSILRQIANIENQDPIGPEGDPKGWRTVDPVVLRGKVFSTRPVEATCTLSVARPLCFARGTTISLILSISCSDSQALDLLSSTSAPNVVLTRRAFFSLHVSINTMDLVDPNDAPSEVVSNAAWWSPRVHSSNDGSTRVLYGEIRIPTDAPPSCHIVNFQLQYAITLLDFKAVAFASADAGKRNTSAHGLLSEPVEIVTAPAHGLATISSSPPIYDSVSL